LGLFLPQSRLRAPGSFFKSLLSFLFGLRVNRTRHDFPPSVSVEHPIDGGVMDLMVQQILEGSLDLAGHANLARGGKLKEWLEKLGFLVLAQIASAPYAIVAALDRFWTESVVPGYHVMHGRNRNIRMDSDLRGRPWVNQGIPDHKPSALFSPAVCLSRIDTSNSERCGSADVTPPITCLP